MMNAMNISIQLNFVAFKLLARRMFGLLFLLTSEQFEPTSFVLVFVSISSLLETVFTEFFFFYRPNQTNVHC